MAQSRPALRFGVSFPNVMVGFLIVCNGHGYAQTASWPMYGLDVSNTASNSLENTISTANASDLKQAWVARVGGDVSARAAVVDDVVYVPDWGGNLWALSALNGSVVWSHQISDYGLASGTVSRTTPAVANGVLYIGTQEGAYLLAIDAESGGLIWKQQLESVDPLAIITTSASVYNGVIYTGISSDEGSLVIRKPSSPGRGSVVAVNATTGAIQWKTYMVPSGYAGASVWGSNPVVDPELSTIFVGTGNNFSTPTDPTYLACVGAGGSEASCLSPVDYVDSIVALDMATGAVKWAQRLADWSAPYTPGSDDYNAGCVIDDAKCPANRGPDYDFGSAPNEITYQTVNGPQKILGVGQKSGIYYALDPVTGNVLWQTAVGPGGEIGGIEWGSASDGTRIYVAISNLSGVPYAAGTAGSWAALDPATGAILWQRADPNGAVDLAPMTVANGVVYAASMAGAARKPTMLALDAGTGTTLWSFAAGSSVNAGASVVNGRVFWGSGYSCCLPVPQFTGNNRIYAFSIGGN